jgi:hypothetical protein
MLFDAPTLAGIADGRIRLVFRRWAAPRVKAGRTQLTGIGLVRFAAVERVDSVSVEDAALAGFESVDKLLARAAANDRGHLDLYKITVEPAGADPRIALRESAELDADELARLSAKLDRMDRAAVQPWTRDYLATIADQPGVVARELAIQHGMERDQFKLRIRRLKALGLTESLPVGYQLSPRGQAFLDLTSTTKTEEE